MEGRRLDGSAAAMETRNQAIPTWFQSSLAREPPLPGRLSFFRRGLSGDTGEWLRLLLYGSVFGWAAVQPALGLTCAARHSPERQRNRGTQIPLVRWQTSHGAARSTSLAPVTPPEPWLFALQQHWDSPMPARHRSSTTRRRIARSEAAHGSFLSRHKSVASGPLTVAGISPSIVKSCRTEMVNFVRNFLRSIQLMVLPLRES